jgi:hypothetical protein
MATMLVHHKVKDFAAWKKVFDSVKDLRTSSGETSATLYQQDGDPNNLTLVFGWDSMENAKKYAHSSELKAAMEKAGVVGAPTIHFLNKV